MEDSAELTNPERDQDRVADLFDTWQKHRYVMFPQQQVIYANLAKAIGTHSILEAGCGTGQGSAVLERSCRSRFCGTDKHLNHVAFAKSLYPWISFNVWDATEAWFHYRFHTVAAVEVIEHVADVRAALRNLLAAAKSDVWISTPNGNVGTKPPGNPFHVQEYAPEEMVGMLRAAANEAYPSASPNVGVLAWNTFEPVPLDTDVTPLVYKVTL